MEIFAAVAQLDRVLGYEPRGRGFDSCQPRQNTVKGRLQTSFFFIKNFPSICCGTQQQQATLQNIQPL